VFTVEDTGTPRPPANVRLPGSVRGLGSPAVAISGPPAAEFTVLAQPAPSLAAGASATVTIRFRPLTSGTHAARVSIINDTDQSPYDFAVSGASP
jgi:hypothetical protein